MTTLLYIVLYACALVCLAACAARAIGYARAPLHLRWELYPVPHEAADRVKHGGSYFETADWWKKPTHFNPWGEMAVMVPEILFLKGLWEFNRKLWFRSFPFHFGLYLLIAGSGLVLLHTLMGLFAPGPASGAIGSGLQYAYRMLAFAGALLCMAGSLGLLLRRLCAADLKTYTTKGDIFNLLFFIATLGILLSSCFFREPGSTGFGAVARGLLTFDTGLEVPGLLAAGLLSAALLAAYIPLTHMSHFIAKYFTYHSVRWDDKPNRRGGSIEARLAEYLTYRPTWSAAHVGADGVKTWGDIATSNPARDEK